MYDSQALDSGRTPSDIGRSSGPNPAARSRARLLTRWTAGVTGVAALIWFLIRVIPKPSRAAYPCQRAAFPIAAAFVTYLLGLSGAAVALRRARRYLGEARYVVASVCLVAMLACMVLTGDANPSTARAGFVPPDPPNTPMGVARGIFPGRVTWAWNPDATTGENEWYDRGPEFYWDDAHTSQTVVDRMMSDCVRWLTDKKTDEKAWKALFKHYNRTHGRGRKGYKPGEKIFIKTNHVDQREHADNDNRADIVPQIELALLKQLVNEAGVRQADITLGDPSRYIADKCFDRCHAVFPDVVYGEGTFFEPQLGPGTEGRVPLTSTTQPVLHFSGMDNSQDPPVPIPDSHVSQICVDATYIVNLGVMKGHMSAGVTLSGKNWYGCLGERPGGERRRGRRWGGAWPGDPHHSLLPDRTPEANHYRLMVDLMGYKDLGGKTMLYVLDGLWGFERHGGDTMPLTWWDPPFNEDYPSSILMSQDPVAIDSVGLDFLRAEFGDNMGGSYIEGAIDDYLHEAALADKAPSGTVYDPENDGVPCESLGVHEHWNNSVDKQYSRNLGTGKGIELVNRGKGLDRAPTRESSK
ncbi:DUF362 domain-containing protein [Candidatus Sumerlaeota bacterium]|nr:DUF362 domain-containing protein [Candidatus Sumerlaeota bacterium]